ncbi:YybH family protein [Nocardia carnea]|uniref:YybH family protein n=1 Tax=Nocardia carnea TaxID=37328 RepID=UPI0024571153|nr:nuclear transport factor 2 family protein [Nocardia carnea]
MPASTPRALQEMFLEKFGAKDIDGLSDCYEENAVFVSPTGAKATTLESIREQLTGLLAAATTSFVLKPTVAIEVDGVALMHADWALEGTAPDGSALSMSGATVEVARRQPTGEWRYVVDSPIGIVEAW